MMIEDRNVDKYGLNLKSKSILSFDTPQSQIKSEREPTRDDPIRIGVSSGDITAPLSPAFPQRKTFTQHQL